MMKLSKVLACVLLVTAGLGLSNADQLSEAETDLVSNETLWDSFGFLNYDMLYQDFSHAVGPPYSDPLQVQVRNGNVLTAIDTRTGKDVTLIVHVMTIPEVFALLNQTLTANPVDFNITYDSMYGYPLQAYINPKAMLVGGQISLTISKLMPDPSLDFQSYLTIWKNSYITNYKYAFDETCNTCNLTYPVNVDVQNETVIAKVTNFWGDTIKADKTIVTIDGLFDMIAQAINGSANNTVSIHYDAMYGYPAQIHIGYANTSDVVDLNVTNFVPYSIVQNDLDNAMQTWASLAITDYDYVGTTLCFCVLSGIDFLVSIRNDTVVNVTNIGTGATVGNSQFGTIESAFALIQEYITNQADSIDVTYNGDYGYPTSISIDPNFGIADNEIGFSAKSLVVFRNTPEQRALTKYRALWNAQNTTYYVYTFEKSSFVVPQGPLSVEVYNNTVVSVFVQQTGMPGDEFTVSTTPTVGQIFTIIQSAIDQNTQTINVTYNPDLGYPETVYINSGIPDTAFRYVVSNLSLLTYEVNFTADATWQSGLSQALDTWDSLGLSTYTYILQRFCVGSCLSLPSSTPQRVEVMNGLVVSVNGVAYNETMNSNTTMSNVSSIEELFMMIQDAIDQFAYDVSVTYNDTYGNPTNIFIQYDETNHHQLLATTQFLPDNGAHLTGTTPPTKAPTASTPSVSPVSNKTTSSPVAAATTSSPVATSPTPSPVANRTTHAPAAQNATTHAPVAIVSLKSSAHSWKAAKDLLVLLSFGILLFLFV